MGNTLEVALLSGADVVHAGLRVQVLNATDEVIAEGALTTGEASRWVAELSASYSVESVSAGCAIRILRPGDGVESCSSGH